MSLPLVPLPERVRPVKIEEIAGQNHLTGHGKPIQQMIQSGVPHSFILWGPPGCGKTTLAQVIAQNMGLKMNAISAVHAGVKEIRLVLEKIESKRPEILFIDEIHRFNKAQQDSLLNSVEKGEIFLLGATTENPSFEVNAALLSRCETYRMNPLSFETLLEIGQRAIRADSYLQKINFNVIEWDVLIEYSGGDGRRLLNLLEKLSMAEIGNNNNWDNIRIQIYLQKNPSKYDKKGEMHYDTISAFIKSMRGSDPNATLYWMARMIQGGEDPLFIARRMLIFASEDIGNSNPTALVIANACFQAMHQIGFPEGRIILSQTAIYLSTSSKSNSCYVAIENALKLADKYSDVEIPLHLKNPVTGLMKKMEYGKEYKYPHSFDDNFVNQEYFPNELVGTKIFEPGNNNRENLIRTFLKAHWRNKYEY